MASLTARSSTPVTARAGGTSSQCECLPTSTSLRPHSGRRASIPAGGSTTSAGGSSLQPAELFLQERHSALEPRAVLGEVEPSARPGRMWQRDDRDATELVALADADGQRGQAEQCSQCETACSHDQRGAEELELPAAPERAQLALAQSGRAVAASRRRAARIATRHGRAVESRVELVLVELEPPAQRLTGAAAPGEALGALDDPGRLAVHVCALAVQRRAN